MADVLKQKCLRLLGHVKQQLRQLMGIWISCKLLPKGYRGEGKELRRSLCTLLTDWPTSSGELVGTHLHFLIELILCEWSHYGIKVLLVYRVQYYQDQYSVIFNIFSTSSFLLCHMERKKNVRSRILYCGGVIWLWFGQSFEIELPARPLTTVSSPEKSVRL